MIIAGKTDVGKVRTHNEDAFFIDYVQNKAVVAVICDGMGGENAGHIASSDAVSVISKRIIEGYTPGMPSNSIRNLLLTTVTAANKTIYHKSKENLLYKGMGTTVVAAVIEDNMVYMVAVGDSRAYHITPKKIVQISKDHSMVQLLLEQGQITKDQAKAHPQKNLITRALGVGAKLDLDYIECPVDQGDSLLICTDGLTNSIPDKEIFEIASENLPKTACQKLISAANAAGGSDNITILMIKIDK